jgi:hypothetical protein
MSPAGCGFPSGRNAGMILAVLGELNPALTVSVQRTRDGGLCITVGETVLARHRRPTHAHEVMTGDLPPVTLTRPPAPVLSRSGRLVLTGPQVERRSLAQYEAVMPQ